ncbi:hypothetical protein I553_10042 [Mycobacterium xenopi 4042]|uniref:Uncharacterized protein n=1 Tax=Mycobacterium xenopi 4042 TaxID=1299334 RepID=X7YRE7_MYCXE|nr:hypothetical protein I553_10042 [Mycobacterium xenopi 4042]
MSPAGRHAARATAAAQWQNPLRDKRDKRLPGSQAHAAW